ncbi:MAG: peptidase [Phycisphaerae bacterium]|nr:peptidase [Phycisphaerae bacterium]
MNGVILLILVGGYAAGKLFSALRLPSVLGMTLWGIGISLFFRDAYPPVLDELSSFLRSTALIIILLRAGLGIHKKTLQKVGKTALLMAFVPCLFEGLALTGLFYWLTPFDLLTSGLTGFLLAAVSPAVVVPSMLELKENGLGRQNDVPTIILAGASLDDIFSITIFLVFLNLLRGESVSAAHAVLSIPVSAILGIIPGIVLGLILARYFNAHYEKVRATEKTLLLLASSIFLLQVGDWLHTAALLGVMTVGFILLEKAERAAHELAYNLNKMWVFAEIILFVLVGMAVDVRVAMEAGPKGAALILLGLLARSTGVYLATAFSTLTYKERLFCMIAYTPKATVQAAMGAVALSFGLPYGKEVLAYAVLAILITAPLGLIGIRLSAKHLLKTGDIAFH